MLSDKYGDVDMTDEEYKEYKTYSSEYKQYLMHRAYWVYGNVTGGLHHFYTCVKVDVGQNKITNIWEVWFEVQFEKDDDSWTREYPAECFIHHRPTYIYMLRYIRARLKMKDVYIASKVLVGARKKPQNAPAQ